MKYRLLTLLVFMSLLVSCAETPVKSNIPFQLTDRDYLYDKVDWSFSGRLALSDKDDSFSGSISWMQQGAHDYLELAGPFGQGRTLIAIFEDNVVVDYGDERLQYFGDVDEVVSTQLGVEIPVSALKYWVLGLVKPSVEYSLLENGFLQSGWRVQYQVMDVIGEDVLPSKVRVERNDVKLKLIINQWDL